MLLHSDYGKLCDIYYPGVDVAVRSSATTEDSKEASFAGQYESFLNVSGEVEIVEKWRRCVASMFTERSVGYHLENGMHLGKRRCRRSNENGQIGQGMLWSHVHHRPGLGHRGVIHIASSYGLGELVVQGVVIPDTFTIWKEGLRRGKSPIVYRTLGTKEQMLVYDDQLANEVSSVRVPWK